MTLLSGGPREAAGRLTLAALLALVLAEFRYYAPMLLLLVLSILADYLSGVAKSFLAGRAESGIGLRGLVKKLCYLLAVCAGFFTDLLIALMGQTLGLQMSARPLFGLLVTVLLTLNELLSIVENLGEIGLPLPAALKQALLRLRDGEPE